MLKEKLRLYTIAEYFDLPKQMTDFTELVQGQIVPKRKGQVPAGHEHGGIAANLLLEIALFVRRHRLGKVYAAETGFILNEVEQTVRAPDVAFVRQDKLPQPKQTGYFVGAPALAVEVISPSETYDDVEDKIEAYLNAGVEQVWIVRPRAKSVAVYQSAENLHIYDEADMLHGGEVLPNFELPVSQIFE